MGVADPGEAQPSTTCRGLVKRFIDAFADFYHCGVVSAPRTDLTALPLTPARLPSERRIVAVGDLHGDFEKAKQALVVGKVVDNRGNWIGGDSVLVQVGDQMDRGSEEIKILVWLERLQHQAARAGGAVHVLNGNHETISVEGKFRYCFPGGYKDFDRWFDTERVWRKLLQQAKLPVPASTPRAPDDMTSTIKNRWRGVRPGGPITTRFFARHNVVQGIGSTVFVHGGLLPEHIAQDLDFLNEETRRWMTVADPNQTRAPDFIRGRNAVVWSRHFSRPNGDADCELLQEALEMAGFKRMVVGHTIQQNGITTACNGMVWRVDVGLSAGCGDGKPQALEILQDEKLNVMS